MGGGLPSPPLEDRKPHGGSRKSSSSSSSKSLKPQRHTSKRASSHNATAHHEQAAHGVTDGRHKRVWKACERCRMKKTKCDGEFPCKRCKDDGLVCTAGVRKKTEYKQLPKGYAEVLEHTQFALVATVHKLYAMVRNQQQWDLGEPELNDRGQPVIHNIAANLGCIRPNTDIDLPVSTVFPEDEAGMAELARQLDEQQKERERDAEKGSAVGAVKMEMDSQSSGSCNLSERSSSSDLDHSEFETDYRRQFFGGNSHVNNNGMTLSPQSLTGYTDLDADSLPSPIGPGTVMFPTQTQIGAPPQPAFSAPQPQPQQQHQQWTTKAPQQHVPPAASMGGLAGRFVHQPGLNIADMGVDLDMLNQGLLESEFGTIKPHILSCPNPEVMMGMGDPMIYSGYDADAMRL